MYTVYLYKNIKKAWKKGQKETPLM